ncbi:Protein CBG27947 [Caenorhabditis briggsae]|uniref:Uncharacterized protein n=2 Tax=Caenorhabditis briggsae TaxID=6238 RepID=A0AAE9CWP3_CAEBR|nr:Protein CBG27947 [Caenorhabditis briggsae]ULT83796.1 hypothetical protein L3Y34_012815 [Caenorhabditis briggsae]CAS00119.1 Protein CBG27947 [Caenorhabditis briggsae]
MKVLLLLLLLALVVKLVVLLPTSSSQGFRLRPNDWNTRPIAGLKLKELATGKPGKTEFSITTESVAFFVFNATLTASASVELTLETSSDVQLRVHRCNWNTSLGFQSSGTVTLPPHVKRSMLELDCYRDKTRIIFSLESTAQATGTVELEITADESFFMLAAIVVLFSIFVGIAAVIEYKHSE